MKIDHLTSDQLAGVLHDPEPDIVWLEHLRTCADCRNNLATQALERGLMAELADASGNHLQPGRIRQLHAEAFERENTSPKAFLAGLQHVANCSVCYARFFALHQDLTPSKMAIAGALLAFDAGQPRRLGLLRVFRSYQRVLQTFRDDALAVRQSRSGYPHAVSRQDEHFSARFAPAESAGDFDIGPATSASVPASVPRHDAADAPQATLNTLADIESALSILRKELGQSYQRYQNAERRADSSEMTSALTEIESLDRRIEETTSWLTHARAMLLQSVKGGMQRVHEVARLNADSASSEPTTIEIPGASLTIVSQWTGRRGRLEIVATDASTGAARPGVEFTAIRGRDTEHRTLSDADGRAVIELDEAMSGIRISLGKGQPLSILALKVDVRG